MLAARIHQHGGTDKLKLDIIPEPVPGKNHALIKIYYSALNHLDLFVLKGMPGLRVPLPLIPGSDMAGEIVEITGSSGEFSPGDHVAVYPGTSCGDCDWCKNDQEHYCKHYGILGETQNGGHCQYISVPFENLVKVPKSFPLEQVAAAGLTFLTAHEMLYNKADIKENHTVLVLAANSGVGSAAIQLAKYKGCEIIATAGNEEKITFAHKLGANHVVNHYDNPEWFKEVKNITLGRGADIIIEHPGAATFSNSLKALAIGGKLISCGATSGADISFDLRHIFIKQQQIIGSTMGSLNGFKEIISLLINGHIKAHISQIYPIENIKKAYDDLENNKVTGKLVLKHFK